MAQANKANNRRRVIPWNACGRPRWGFGWISFSPSTQNGKFDWQLKLFLFQTFCNRAILARTVISKHYFCDSGKEHCAILRFWQREETNRIKDILEGISACVLNWTSSVPCYASSKRVYRSLGLPNEPTSSATKPACSSGLMKTLRLIPFISQDFLAALNVRDMASKQIPFSTLQCFDAISKDHAHPRLIL